MKKLIQRAICFLKATKIGRSKLARYRRSVYTNKNNAFKAMAEFGFGELSDEEKEAKFEDMRDCFLKGLFSFSEYFLYDLAHKSDDEKAAFIADFERMYYLDKLNTPWNYTVFGMKPMVASRFAPYFKRDFLWINSYRDKEKLREFIGSHSEVFIKPISSTFGYGITKVSRDETSEEQLDALMRNYCRGLNGAIVEEAIRQDERMKKLHPQSINTLRMTTIRLNDETILFYPRMRVGRGDSYVDNARQGGIVNLLDSEGKIYHSADGNRVCYEVHPESGERLIGFQVPLWEEAVALAKELAQVIPTNRYTGWDLALGDKGWCLVEANARGQWYPQLILRKGFRAEIEGYFQRLGIKPPRATKYVK